MALSARGALPQGGGSKGGAWLAPDLLLTRDSLARQNGRGGRGIERKEKKKGGNNKEKRMG